MSHLGHLESKSYSVFERMLIWIRCHTRGHASEWEVWQSPTIDCYVYDLWCKRCRRRITRRIVSGHALRYQEIDIVAMMDKAEQQLRLR